MMASALQGWTNVAALLGAVTHMRMHPEVHLGTKPSTKYTSMCEEKQNQTMK